MSARTMRSSCQPHVLAFLTPTFLRNRNFRPPLRCPLRTLATAVDTSTASNTLVIVESPAKATTIQSILSSSQYTVRSCVGHIREIPSSAKRIPARYKSLPWARLGVDVDNDFRPIYVLISGKQAVLRDLKKELQKSTQLILATDDDREGEAISWHLTEVLKPEIPVKRAVFHEITTDAIHRAFANCRDVDLNLVQAQEARRVLDRLAGYTMSPLLWKKIARGLSAGRVQSVAMSVIVRREQERLRFCVASYCGAVGTFTVGSKTFNALLAAVDNKRLVKGSDFEDETGDLTPEAREKGVRRFDHDSIQVFCESLDRGSAVVRSVDRKQVTRNPPLPLITSTLQQECGNKLGMGAGRTMRVAQKLYEHGHITYMRTDNPTLSDQAVDSCREAVTRFYGKESLWDGKGNPRKSKPKASQAAHEAIRPAGSNFLRPEEIEGLSEEERAVYRIIFRRTLASQMACAKLAQTTVKIEVPLLGKEVGKNAEFRTTGSVVITPGFLQVFEKEETDSQASGFLPPVDGGDALGFSQVDVSDHKTKPPPRFNDASLVKVLEELGVGRPSTYAGIIEKLILRGYLHRGKALPEEKGVSPRSLVPSLTAFAVEKLLREHFPSFVDAEFTAHMEEALDMIATGSAERTKYLQEYYCGGDGLAASVERTEKEIDATKFRQILLPNMPSEMQPEFVQLNSKNSARVGAEEKSSMARQQENIEEDFLDWTTTKVLVSSYGPYIEQDGEVVASLPKTTIADDLAPDRLQTILQIAKDPLLGTDPNTGQPILLKTSRYGPYVQLGRDEDTAPGTKPKRCSLFPGMDVGTLTVELASRLLSLPRLLGEHPRTGEEVRAAMGPYGPYVVHESTYVSLKKDEHDVLEIGFEDALSLIDAAEKRKQMRLEKQKEKADGKEQAETRKGKARRPNAARRTKVKTTAQEKVPKAAAKAQRSVIQ